MLNAQDAAKDQCPVELSARIIGQKWTLQLVNHLIHGGPLRFCELQDALGGVNPSTLSSRLKMLEEEGIVERTQCSTVPPHVEYSLTPKGASLGPVIAAIRMWGNRWLCGETGGSTASMLSDASPDRQGIVAGLGDPVALSMGSD